jgi:hypothetical protein
MITAIDFFFLGSNSGRRGWLAALCQYVRGAGRFCELASLSLPFPFYSKERSACQFSPHH